MKKIKRKVFYLGGYDPRGVRYYYGLLVEQVNKYAGSQNIDIEVSQRSFGNEIYSQTKIENKTQNIETDYVFLRWEDFVTDSWIRNPFELGLKAAATYRDFIAHSDFAHAKRLGRGPMMTLFYPMILTIAVPIVLLVFGFLASIAFVPYWAALLIGAALMLFAGPALLTASHAPWLLRFFIFNNALARGEWPSGLEQRLDTFAELVSAPADEYDEVLLISHSNGSILAIPLLDRLRSRWNGSVPTNFTLVTLGQCIPLLALRHDATGFVEQLRRLANFELRWVDIGSPPDGAAYYGVDPLLLRNESHCARIELLSPRFHLFYDPATYHSGLRNKYEIHFDYLRTGDRVSPIDFPSLVAGDLRIEEAVESFRKL